MTSTRKVALTIAGAGALSMAAYVAMRPAPSAPSVATDAPERSAAAAPVATGNTVLTSAKTSVRRSGKFVGEWEQTGGSVKVTCNGKLAKEVPVAGKRFKITEEGGTLRFSDNACEFPLRVHGSVATAASDTCAPKAAGSPPVRITTQSLETDGEVAKVSFEGQFQTGLPQGDNKPMACSVTAQTVARRL